MLRLTVPTIEGDDLAAVSEVLESGFLVQGPKVEGFERAVADYVGTKHAIAVSNCTAALHLALLALDVRPGDLVVVPSYSWVATANVIELCGARPVFTDIRPDTFNMDAQHLDEIVERLSSNKATSNRVKAILPVHAFGQLSDMPEIMAIANKHGIPVIEDAACALGATMDEKQAGTWGVMGCFSFHPRKAVTTGEGGMITTDDEDLAWRLRVLRNHGQDPASPTPDFVMPGLNYRVTEFQAALGLTQMAKLKRIIHARRAAAVRYDSLLEESPLTPPGVAANSEHVYQSYVTLLPKELAPKRSGIISQLRMQGVETNIGTWHIPLTSYYRNLYGYLPGDFPLTDDVFARALTLPLFEGLTEREQQEVVALVCKQVTMEAKA
jgi:perosamine synthetase